MRARSRREWWEEPPEIEPRPFRGSEAVAAGRISRGCLRGPSFERLVADVYVETGHELDRRHRALAASVWGGRGTVVAGWGAVALWDLDVAPCGVRVDLLVDRACRPPAPWIVPRRDEIADDEILLRHDVAATGPARTAVDLARWYDLPDALIGADALARMSGLRPDDLRRVARRRPGRRGMRAVPRVAELVDGGAESPPETRMRLAVVLGGLPRPVTQYPVRLASGKGYRLDLAWPQAKVALEYDGEEHRSITRHGLDLDRDAALRALGWLVIRVTDRQLRRPEALLAQVGAALASR